MRRTFRDPELDEVFRREGYVVTDLLDDAQLAVLKAAAADLYRGERAGMHTTIQSPDHDYRSRVIEALPPLVWEPIDRLYDDHDDVLSSLLVKWPGDDTAFVTHQDWCMVDERRYRAANVWIPLVDVDERNGAMAVLPGSHHYLDHLRCCPRNPIEFRSEWGGVTIEEMEVIPMRAGQALHFDTGLLHGSPPNATSTARDVAVVMVKPREAESLHYYLPDGHSWEAERYVVDRSFFSSYEIGERPRARLDGREDFYGTPRTKEGLLAACGRPGGGAAR